MIKDITGLRAGRLTVIRFDRRENDRTYWVCLCDCGTEKVVGSTHLVQGKTNSCGCLVTTHGQTGSRLYTKWNGMRARCRGLYSVATYKDRGITVCPEWDNSFEAFQDWALANGYADNLTIDRRDNNGNYEPSNCRWVDVLTQNRNRSITAHLTISDETKTAFEWATDPRSEMTYTGIWKRMSIGWPRNIQILKKVTRLHAESWAYAELMGAI